MQHSRISSYCKIFALFQDSVLEFVKCPNCMWKPTLLVGRASSLGAGVRQRRNSSGVTDKLTDRPPLSPWCNASTHGKLTQLSPVTNIPQITSELSQDASDTSADCPKLGTATSQSQHMEPVLVQPHSMFTDLPCSHTPNERDQLSQLQLSDVMLMQQVSSSKGTLAAVDMLDHFHQHTEALQQQSAFCLHGAPLAPSLFTLPCNAFSVPATAASPAAIALPVPAASSVAIGMDIDSHDSNLQHDRTALHPVVATSNLSDPNQTFNMPCSAAPSQHLAQRSTHCGGISQVQSVVDSGRRRSFSPLSRGPESVLPTTENPETGLPSISCSTLAQLLSEQHSYPIGSVQMIDCRSGRSSPSAVLQGSCL